MADWWRSFFTEGLAEVIADVFDPESTAAQLDGIERLLGLRPGDRVLDVPCGQGRLTVPLASRGYRAAGADLTAEFLAAARREAETAGVEVEWAETDMRELPWDGEFDGAFCYGGSFGYFDDDGNLAFLRGGRASAEARRRISPRHARDGDAVPEVPGE